MSREKAGDLVKVPQVNGIDELRAAVRLFNNCREDFNQEWTAEGLLMLYRAYKRCGWDIAPDEWTDWQLWQVQNGKDPEWDANERPIEDAREEDF